MVLIMECVRFRDIWRKTEPIDKKPEHDKNIKIISDKKEFQDPSINKKWKKVRIAIG